MSYIVLSYQTAALDELRRELYWWLELLDLLLGILISGDFPCIKQEIPYKLCGMGKISVLRSSCSQVALFRHRMESTKTQAWNQCGAEIWFLKKNKIWFWPLFPVLFFHWKHKCIKPKTFGSVCRFFFHVYCFLFLNGKRCQRINYIYL